jgi:hypothetical protein
VTGPTVATWLVSGYAVFLAAAAWGFDVMARRASDRAQGWRTGRFVRRPDHDAWQSPTEPWLRPTAFEPSNRVMHYGAEPVVSETSPVQSDGTSRDVGRAIGRPVDPWPFSEAGRFHRGIACAVAVLAIMLLLGQAAAARALADLLVLGTVCVIVTACSAPLFRQLRRTPISAPEHDVR